MIISILASISKYNSSFWWNLSRTNEISLLFRIIFIVRHTFKSMFVLILYVINKLINYRTIVKNSFFCHEHQKNWQKRWKETCLYTRLLKSKRASSNSTPWVLSNHLFLFNLYCYSYLLLANPLCWNSSHELYLDYILTLQM